jgi:hypothetical protein
MARHRHGNRHGALVRVGGLGLVAAGVLASGSAWAASGSESDLYESIRSMVSGAMNDANARSYGTGSDPGDTGTGSGGAWATAGGGSLNSFGNSGVGACNQIDATVQAPITVNCNAIALFGSAVSTCPTDNGHGGGAPSGYHHGGTPGGNAPRGGTPGGSTPGSGTPGGSTTGRGTPGGLTPGAPTVTGPRSGRVTTPVTGRTQAGPKVLAQTGAPAMPIGYAGGALLLLGGMIVLTRRRPARGRHCAA